MKRYIRASNLSKLSGNKFWDSTSKNPESSDKREDLRREFIQELRKYWDKSPYRLKSRNERANSIQYLGLFGTGEGLRFKRNTFPLKKDYDLKQLISDFAKDNNIPVYILNNYDCLDVFSNKYSYMQALQNGRSYGGYDVDKIDKAKQETYGETAKRRYSIRIHAGNFRKEKSGKYVVEAQNILEPLDINDIKSGLPDISDIIIGFEKKMMMDGDKWNEGNADLYLITERELTPDEYNELEDYFNDLLSSIPQDMYRVSLFKHLAY